jgi:hypothetical protein
VVSELIRQILMRSIYWGKWRIVHTPTQESDIWSAIDAKLECDISDLAYWSESEAREFQMQFLESYKPAMRTMFDHPIVGLVACHICSEPFIGCGDGRMRCVNYLSPGICPAPVYIQESGAWPALNLYFPLIADQVVDLIERLDLHLRQLRSTGVQSRLTALDRRERALGSLPEVFAEHKRLVQGELERIERQRAELRKNSGDVRRGLAAFETVARLADVIRTDPVGA